MIIGRGNIINRMADYRARMARRITYEDRPKIREEINIRTAPRRRIDWAPRPRGMEALGEVTQPATGGFSWLTDLLKTGIQTWGATKVAQVQQKGVIDAYGGPRTLQAMSAIDAQRAYEARQRALELERMKGVTAPLLSGATPWLIGGAVVLGAVLLLKRR